MDAEHANYLRSLVRMDVRKKEKQISRLRPKPGQTQAILDGVKVNMERSLEFRRRVLDSLKGDM